MTDVYDRASDIEQAQRDDALQAQQRRAAASGINADKTWKDSALDCRVCHEPIPLKRRKALPGVETCIDCQTELEHALRQTT